MNTTIPMVKTYKSDDYDEKILYILTAFLMASLTIRAQEVIEEDSLYYNEYE